MWNDIRTAFSFLTIFPLGFPSDRKAGWSMAWYPLVGLVIGLILMFIAQVSPFHDGLRSVLVLFTWVFITGGLHLDGFGDSCDGLLATVSPERRLDIMKDPRTGTWAVVGLVLLLLVKWQAIGQIPFDLLIIPPVLGRWAMVLAMYSFPYARKSGLGSFFAEGFGRKQVYIATAITIVIVLQTNYSSLLLTVFCFVWLFGKWAASRLNGGLTGDVYGAICELTEVLCLLVIGASYG